ncbi:MAG: MarR family transcriptional regulator [Gammaproteobacteria bacterium]|nr:MarR family transcriptional regulator [Gammaproteobacteria bacterium]
MATLPQEIVALLESDPGLTDREITNRLRTVNDPQQPINIAARNLASKGVINREKRADGLIGNYRTGPPLPVSNAVASTLKNGGANELSEDECKKILEKWLKSSGWQSEIAWGHARGIDVDARRGGKRWIIEVKGIGSRQPMRVNYFIGMLGETLQRMDDEKASYSIAIPDVQQFRNLWGRLPTLAKQRTGITALFIDSSGSVSEVGS